MVTTEVLTTDPATNVVSKAPDYTKYETLCSVLNPPNDKPVASQFPAVTERTDNEGSEGDDESTENDLHCNEEGGRQQPCKTRTGRHHLTQRISRWSHSAIVKRKMA
jgi:hypothetical protein